MNMTIKIPKHKNRFRYSGEVKTLKKILQLIMTMNHDEQYRTLTYLSSRFQEQFTIGEIEHFKVGGKE